MTIRDELAILRAAADRIEAQLPPEPVEPPEPPAEDWTRTIHVDWEAGDDANDGLDPERPRKTPPAPQPGDRILIRGRYRGFVEIPAGGTPEAPVIYEGDGAVIDGSEPLGPWTEEEPGIWSAPAPRDPLPVVIADGVRLPLASSVKTPDPWEPHAVDRFARLRPETSTGFRDAALAERLRDSWRGAWLRLHYGHNHVGEFRVVGVDGDLVQHEEAPAAASYALVNHRSVWTAPGEALIEGGRIFVRLDAAPEVAGAARLSYGIRNLGHSHVVIRGLRFTGHTDKAISIGDWRNTARTTGVVVEDCISTQGGGILLMRADDSALRRCHVEETVMGQPIWVRDVARAHVVDNVCRRGETGLTVYGAVDSLFLRNRTTETLGIHGNALTIYEGAHRCRFIGNVVQAGKAGFGITLRQSGDLLFAFNVVHGKPHAVRQHAEMEGGDQARWVCNTIIGTFRVLPATAARTSLVNNAITGLGMSADWQRFPVRRFNVYGFGTAPQETEWMAPDDPAPKWHSLFTYAGGGDPLEPYPAAWAWERLRAGEEIEAAGVVASHVGAWTPDGPVDLSTVEHER